MNFLRSVPFKNIEQIYVQTGSGVVVEFKSVNCDSIELVSPVSFKEGKNNGRFHTLFKFKLLDL